MGPHGHIDYEGESFLPSEHNDTYSAINPLQWDLSGKAVLVTGASRGVGRSTAISFGKAGATYIALMARSASALDETEAAIMTNVSEHRGEKVKPKVLKLVVDVTDEKAIADAEAQVRSDFGRIDIVVNNAGYLSDPQLIADSEPTEWWKSWEINIKGTYLITRAFLPLLMESQEGSKIILNVASNGAFHIMKGLSGYQPSKLALLRFNEFIAAEYGDKGILAIAVHPCTLKSDMGLRLPQDFLKNMNDTPEIAADTIVWLTKERREWLQGRYVDCCWDMLDLETRKEEIVNGNKLKPTLTV